MRSKLMVWLLATPFLFLSTSSFAQDEDEEEIIEEEIIEEEEVVDEEELTDEESAEEELVEEEVSEEDFVPERMKPQVSGYTRGDYRYFPKESLYPGQHQQYFSAAFQPEIYMEWNEGKQVFQFTGFGRLDQYDTKRTHVDIRELYWQSVFTNWELSIGVKKIFWGVTESNHIVDIINQADVLEGFDLEAKLGQPMIHAAFAPKWGNLDFMVMTYFRTMQFPGPMGRLRPPFDLPSDVSYEADLKEWNPDFAVRWSHSIKSVDIGISHFYGTSRLPVFQSSDGINFVPFYELINQTGVDLQAYTGSMLWKLEYLHRISKRKEITGFVVGGEYTFSNFLRTGIDVGLIAEYNYDDRGQELISALNDDFFFGTRLAFNDRQSSDLLGGVIIDRDNGTLRYFAEANRRLGEKWKLSLTYNGYDNIDPSEFLYLIRNDGFLEVSIFNYF